MLPDTQYFVELRLKERGYNNKIKEYIQNHVDISASRSELAINRDIPDDERAIKIGEIQKTIECIKIDIDTTKTLIAINKGLETSKNPEKKKFIRACPVTDCKGFLSTKWVCGLCDSKVCNKCHEVKCESEEHVCDENSIKTAELLMKDSRPCPKCASMIFKIEGCDQMFCVMCHTAFSWKTGQIETGRIHNPHYYDIQRKLNNGQMPREVGDEICGGIPNYYSFFRHLAAVLGSCEIEKTISHIHRLHVHVQHIVIPRYETNIEKDFRELRIKFMMNDISVDVFKKQLQQKEKAFNKKRDITMVLQTYVDVSLENLIAMSLCTTKNDMLAVYEKMITLKDYINESLQIISQRYNNVVPLISTSWTMY
jgi:hypothetical protein